MELVKVEDVFGEAQRLLEGKTVDGKDGPMDLERSEKLLNEVLNHNVGHPEVLYVLGSLHAQKGNVALAVQLLSQVTQTNPKFGEAWNNLGLAYRGLNDWDRAVFCCKKAAKYLKNIDVQCNVAGLHVNRGMPEKVLKYAEIALAEDPSHVKTRWHKALALLELQRWNEGWDWHEARLEGGANENIGLRNYHGPDGMTPWWEGQQKGMIVVHGEQGMGDEIMFASCVPDLLAMEGLKVILEPSPRNQGLFERTFPDAIVHGTDELDGRAWIEEHGKPDFKIGLGSLPKFFRRAADAFPGTPYLVADPDRRAWWGDKLRALGRKPKIGIAWQGGVEATRYDTRSFHPNVLAPFLHLDVDFISLQYDQTAKSNVADVKRDCDVQIQHWPKAVEMRDPDSGKPSNMDELAALISKLDMVITVPQTCFHFAGALGIPCLLLTPSEPDWRIGVGDYTTLPWYRSVSLIRQEGNDWGPVIAEAGKRLEDFVGQRKTA